jgi:hypothetical protein
MMARASSPPPVSSTTATRWPRANRLSWMPSECLPNHTITTAPRRSNHSAICTAPQIIPKPPKSQRASVLPSIFCPVPTGADFRVNLGDDARDALAAEIETRTRETMARAQAEPLKRVAETIGALAEKLRALQAHQGEGRAPVLRETALSNVLILADLLPSLNIHQDPALDTLAQDIKNAFQSHNVESLRTQPQAQEQAADAADDILARVAGIFGPAPVSYQHAAQ